MAISIHHVDYDPLQHSLPPRRYAWTVFAIVFALMVVDYVDRQVVVSMFPHLKAQWTLSDGQLGASRLDRVDHGCARSRPAVAARRSLEPRQEHLPDGARLEPRDDRRARSPRSYGHLLVARSIVGLGEAAYGTVGRGAARYACSRRACAARCSARSSPRASWDRCSASCWAASSRRAGAGRQDSARSAYPVCCSRFCSSSSSATTRPLRCQRSSEASRPTSMAAGAIVAALLRPRTALITCVGAGFQLVMVSTT